MTPLLLELRYSGRPNRRRRLNAEEVAQFVAIYEQLNFLLVDDSLCWSCEPRRAYQLFLSDRQSGHYVVSESLVTRGVDEGLHRLETRADDRHRLVTFLGQLVLELPQQDTTKSSMSRRCYEKPKPFITPCSCGGPIDFDDWASRETLINNNCYNFARKDLWCIDGVRVPDGYPGNGDVNRWIDVLSAEGLIHVRDWHTVPAGKDPTGGWHVALALGTDGDFHFLRFDRAQDLWAHKMASLACQTCDGAGRPIRGDGILAANLCGYCVKLFFWAEPEAEN
jgi:hypothetical protein